MRLSVSQRQESLKKLSQHEFDILIIGGGINGAGVARDAASRGLRVALVEARDFASGTSSRSSKLIHGGIRYLENLEFDLVFEALSERSKLFEMAPHLVHPLSFVLPVYKGFRVGMWKLGAGMWLYDALALFQAPKGHRRLSAAETLEDLPLLNPQGLKGAYSYSDAYMDDDRLVIETLRSAAALGAHCVNYVKAASPEFYDGKIVAVHCEDGLSGAQFKVKARHVVSSVGPWSDELGADFIPNWKKILRPTKGVHLTFSRERIQIKDAVVMAEGSRIVFAIPRHEMVIIGTTDTDYRGDIQNVRAEKTDVDYLFKVIAEYFPQAELTRDDVLATYAGIRPLVADGSGEEGKTSREHTIFSVPEGITFVAGGKYTTYRRMSEQTVNRALEHLPLEKRASLKPAHTEVPIHPLASMENMRRAHQLIPVWAKAYSRPEAETKWLADRFGMEAELILKAAKPGEGLWELEARQAINHAMCVSLEDFYLRRVPLFLARKDHGLSEVSAISGVFQELLSWSETHRAEQESRLYQRIEFEMQWRERP